MISTNGMIDTGMRIANAMFLVAVAAQLVVLPGYHGTLARRFRHLMNKFLKE